MTIQRLSDIEFKSAGVSKPLKICVCSFFGAAKNGGVGTATSALIKHLAANGHKVTLLYTLVERGQPINVEQHGSGPNSWQYWTKLLDADGIALDFIPHKGNHRDWAQKSWLVKEFIAKHDFDVVYFDDWQGTGYYSLLAKRAGLAPFSTQLHCIITHATKQWVCDSNNEHLHEPSDIEVLGLERKSIEMADVVIGPSHYILREYESYGWALPEQTYHQPLLLMGPPKPEAPAENVPIDELVFFGRLESRKGLWLFCEALDRIAHKLRGRIVTFLGPVTYAYGISTAAQIIERSTRWPFQIRLLTDLNTEQALEFLQTANRLAVMPSLADNSPCVVYECIESGVPFISTLGSGAEELVDKSCLHDVMVEPNVKALAQKLSDVLENGVRLARPSFDSDENAAAWSTWHKHIAVNKPRLLKQPKSSGDKVALVDVPLLVFVDDGNCALGLLVDNLSSHLKRFGKRANYIVLSSRRGPIKSLLSHLFSGGTNPPVQFFEPDEMEDARKIIGAAQFAFFLDADVEMLTPFFVLGLDMLARNPASVTTCVGAIRRDKHAAASIENLPIGDLPGLSVFGRAIGGPVWGLSPPILNKWLSTLELYDRQIDSYVSASKLGEVLMHRCRLANIPIELIPIVGAMTQQADADFEPSRMQDNRAYCAAMGVTPSLAGGGPAWFAISTYGPNPSPGEELPDLDSTLPSPAVQRDHWDSPAVLAAGFSRPEMAFQLEASFGASPASLRELSEVAIEAVRKSPVLDLADLLAENRAMEFGPDGIHAAAPPLAPKAGREASPAEGETPDVDALIDSSLYVDPRLRIEGHKIRSIGSLRAGGPAKVAFLDIPLSGQWSLDIKLRSRSLDPLFVRAIVIDQRSGQPIGEMSLRPARNEPADLSIGLHRIYGPTAVVVEFSGAEKMEVNFDTLAAK